jgi:hypothetical protein
VHCAIGIGSAYSLKTAVSKSTRTPIHLEETDTTFAIAWKGRYRIDGPAFILRLSRSRDRRTTSILGYPTDKLATTACC